MCCSSYQKLYFLNEHALNKILRTQSLLRIIESATQSSGRGIKGGPWTKVLCHAHKHSGSVYVYDGHYLATIFVLSYLWQPLLCDCKAERCEIKYSHKRLGCSRREKVHFSSL